jgi:hypothetical protein
MITRAVLFKSIEASWGSAEIVTVLTILLDVLELDELRNRVRHVFSVLHRHGVVIPKKRGDSNSYVQKTKDGGSGLAGEILLPTGRRHAACSTKTEEARRDDAHVMN